MLYPRAMPGLVTGMAFFWAFVVLDPTGRPGPSLWAVGLAFAVRSLALGYSAFYPALAALGEDLDRAARTAGADWWTAMRTIVLRLLRPAMAVSFVLLFVAMLNDYDPAVFLVTPGTEVMGLTMLKLWVGRHRRAGRRPRRHPGRHHASPCWASAGSLFGVRPRV